MGKNNSIEILGGFLINNSEALSDKNVNGIFSASLYPFVRSIAQSITGDDRRPIILPTIDFRYIDTNKLPITKNKPITFQDILDNQKIKTLQLIFC